jgi:hypothetical protein
MKPSRSTLCKGCLQQLHLPMAIHGPLSIPFRIVGLRPSRMNPNLCNLCELMFRRIKKSSQVQVPVTILFADVRGYTTVSELLDSPEVVRLLSYFYEQSGASDLDEREPRRAESPMQLCDQVLCPGPDRPRPFRPRQAWREFGNGQPLALPLTHERWRTRSQQLRTPVNQ